MKKIFTLLLFTLITFSFSFGNTDTVNTQGMSFVPSVLTINVGDTVVFNNTGGTHNVNGTTTTFPSNPESFSNPTGVSSGWTYIHVFTISGTYNYQCDPHVPGMVGSITVQSTTDCNGIVNGTALVDTCGTCHQAYIYNFITHVPTFVANANLLVAGVDYDPSQEIVVIPGDPGDPYWNVCPNTIYDIVSNSVDHTTLKAAIDACSLDGVLSGSGPMTLFAPTDAAFNLLPTGTVASLLNNIPQLTDILKHHVVGDSIMSGMLTNGQTVTTLFGADVTVTINSSGDVFIDDAQVILADLVADNGVVHVIDAVLLPTSESTIYDIVVNSPEHTTLKTAIDACSLDGVLSGPGPMTLFAPTDAAFDLLPAGTVASLLNDIPQLTNILKHHVLADSVMSSMLTNGQVATSLFGTDLSVSINSSGDVFIDNAQVIIADLVADNGVVHVIDAVLLPPTTSIIEENYSSPSQAEYLFSLNILGKKVKLSTKNQILFDVYSDGSIIKRFSR